jgi:hypothetical protein
LDPSHPSRFDRTVQAVLLVVLFGLLAMPFLGLALGVEERGLGEKRELAPFPALNLKHYSGTGLIRQMQAYLDDHFGFRGLLVRWNARFITRHLAVSPSPKVVLGKEGWLYYADEHAMDDYRCLQPFTEAELQGWTAVLERRQQWLQRRGAHYLFFVAPNQQTIYPEHLPSTITRVGQVSRLDQLLAYLAQHSAVRAVDLRPALLADKARERVYHRTDTHWNDRGAFVAYQEVCRTVGDWFPGLRPVPRTRFRDTSALGPGGDLAAMLGMAEVYTEKRLGLAPMDPARASTQFWPESRLEALPQRPVQVQETTVPDPSLPRLVMFHDSFGYAMIPFLAEHFSKALFWSSAMAFEPTALDEVRPQLVLQEITERTLWTNYPAIMAGRP